MQPWKIPQKLRKHAPRLGCALVLIASAAVSTVAGAEQSPASYASTPTAGGQSAQSARLGKPAPPVFDRDTAFELSQAAIGRTVGEHVLVDREKGEVRLSQFRGKPLVVSFVYTSCYEICLTTTQNLARAVEGARSAVGEDAFNVVTIGFDVPVDDPQEMRRFARERGVAHEPNWKFLSVADKSSIQRLTDELGFVFEKSPKGYDHLIQSTVLDAQGKVYRQVYGMDFQPAALADPLKELVFGQPVEGFSISAMVDRVRLFCTVYDPATGTYRFNYGMVIGLALSAISLVVMGILLIRLWRKTLRAERC